ncbi:bifunctional methylenetetrahydrofolate dehydrogenase/cyclohydrolase, mitochondrial isoform X3 [Colletes gigas]|uniref:bifunctional methylenetetrahydrofolate dehydrogenase/cyclohydrolase, mitochondrial isoform X3 n=1 Tax=Colletes gigas TaxID=935657 RepID=UPI001C9AF66A|nr:bifunctional methylenetetrahydrofolate dehydrogenase/cyclohydrolase, mitochondrial isoform X3 [Colletes gigas]
MFPWKTFLTVASQRSVRHLYTSKIVQNAIIINGKQIANEIQNDLKVAVNALIKDGKKRPKLVAILIGNNPASKVYVQRKMEVATAIGIESYTIRLEETMTQQDLIKEINHLNADKTVDGILVQLPLTDQMNEHEVCQAIAPNKDVDGFHLENIDTVGKNAVVIGRSKHVGLPIALLLHASGKGNGLNMTTTICHRHTPHTELKKYTKMADLVIAATGVPGLITQEMIKPGACVIDVGITKTKIGDKYKLVGDVDFENVRKVAGYITPVPGGVGPMTVAMLMKNTISVATKNHQSTK